MFNFNNYVKAIDQMPPPLAKFVVYLLARLTDVFGFFIGIQQSQVSFLHTPLYIHAHAHPITHNDLTSNVHTLHFVPL